MTGPLQRAFEMYCDVAGHTELDRIEVRAHFYAGAAACFTLISEALNGESVDPEEALDFMRALAAEIRAAT